MADSDDYGFDDIVLDDQALALLDQEEQKYLHRPDTPHTIITPVVPEGHFNKRHKTTTGWTPGIGANISSIDVDDDLPEISLRGDGSYGIGGRMDPQTDRGQVIHHRNDSMQTITSHSRISDVHASGSRPYTSRQAISPNVRQKPSFHNENSRLQERPGHIQGNNDTNLLKAQMMELQKKLDEVGFPLRCTKLSKIN